MRAAEDDAPVERPYVFAAASLAIGFLLTAAMVAWSSQDPESVVIGQAGRHDAPAGTSSRLANCLDCHVPFLGTPGSRCLSPGCHGELATGTPPQAGKAMPVRFHAALRDYECGLCHTEHGAPAGETARIFHHDLIPDAERDGCQKCHSGTQVKSHATADAVPCRACHETNRWAGVKIEHQNVWQHACEVCHAAPEGETHSSVSGTCGGCHETSAWTKLRPEATK